MEIKQMLAPINANGARSGLKRTRNGGVTMHNTGNYSQGAGARNHGAYLQGGGASKQASWHFEVDDKEIIQSLPNDEVAWHAGDGRGDGNMTTVAIEICVNPDSNLLIATDNAAWLAARELKAQGLGIDHLYQHNHWSGKNCPAEIRTGNPYDWATFKSKVASHLGQSAPSQPTPEQPKPSTGTKYSVGTTVCVYQLNSQSNGGDLVNAHNEGVIGRVIPGAQYPYRVDSNGVAIGWVNDAIIDADPHTPGVSAPQAPTTSITDIAQAVLRGDYGNGDARRQAIANAGYDYATVQAEVNRLLGASTPASKPTVSLDDIAYAVINGDYGNGAERRQALANAGYDPDAVQARVNQLC